MNCNIQTGPAPVREQVSLHRVSHSVFNDETRQAIEDARRGIGLTKGYHSAAELFAALDRGE